MAVGSQISVFRSLESETSYSQAYSAALKLWPIPYEEIFVPTRFGNTHVIASGPANADPLVLLHPAGCGATIWFRNVCAFAQRFRTYAVDTIGEVNLSVLTRPVQSRQGFADWIVDLFAGLQIDKADIVGNSFGGFLTLNTALYLPDRVKHIVLISPAATFVQMWPWIWHFFPAYMSGSKRLLKSAYDWIWQGFPIDPCIAQLRAITSISGVPHHVAPSIYKDGELRSIKAPTLLLIGDHEVIYRKEKAFHRAMRLIPHLKTDVVPNANHNAEYTAAGHVNQTVLAFLTTCHD